MMQNKQKEEFVKNIQNLDIITVAKQLNRNAKMI